MRSIPCASLKKRRAEGASWAVASFFLDFFVLFDQAKRTNKKKSNIRKGKNKKNRDAITSDKDTISRPKDTISLQLFLSTTPSKESSHCTTSTSVRMNSFRRAQCDLTLKRNPKWRKSYPIQINIPFRPKKLAARVTDKPVIRDKYPAISGLSQK
jgi:hypothetical protein